MSLSVSLSLSFISITKCFLKKETMKVSQMLPLIHHLLAQLFSIVVQVQLFPFSSITLPCPTHPHLPPSMCPLYKFLDDPSPSFPSYHPPPPLWLLSVCSLFQCLWLYFACLLVLLIRQL